MYSNEIYYEIISQQNKSIYVVIDLLDWAEEKIAELQGLVTGGSLSLSGDSSIRRTCSLDMTLQEDYDAITSAKNLISINKKIRLRIGVENNLEKYKHLGEKVWFNLGIFILTSCSVITFCIYHIKIICESTWTSHPFLFFAIVYLRKFTA